MSIDQIQKKLETEVQILNRTADHIYLAALPICDMTIHDDETTMHDVLQERADKRIRNQENHKFNSSLSAGLIR